MRTTLLGCTLLLALIAAAGCGKEHEDAEWPAELTSIEGRQPVLWEARHAESGSLVYLFGTIHVSDPGALTLLPAVESAMDRCDAFYAELDLTPTWLQAAVEKLLRESDGGRTYSLRSVMGDALYTDFKSLLHTLFASQLSLHDRRRPWFAMMLLEQSEIMRLQEQRAPGSKLADPLDVVLYRRAADAGKTVGGLETLDEQISAVTCLTDAEQVDMLRWTVRSMKEQRASGEPSVLSRLLAHYLKGDMEKLEALVFEPPPESEPELRRIVEKMMEVHIGTRNQTMTTRLLEKVEEAGAGRIVMAAVGTAHLLGDRSILRLLEKQGYAVKRVLAETKLAPKPRLPAAAK